MREKYCWLAGGWKLVLKRCEKKMLLGWRLLELPNRVMRVVQEENTVGLEAAGAAEQSDE